MSSDPTSSPPASDSQSAAPSKSRNPVERAVVWILIIALLVVCGREALARFGYTNSLNNLQAALEADNVGDVLMIDEIDGHLSGSPSRAQDEANRVISYQWSGLLKDYGTIHLQYSADNEVLGLLTADAPPPETPELSDAEDDGGESLHGADPYDPANSPGEESQGGRGRGFDPMQFDANADGKLTLEEAPERMKERFAEIDTNGDGFSDQEELEAFRATFRRGREGDGNRSARPQRPEEASGHDAANSDADTATEEKPAETSSADE